MFIEQIAAPKVDGLVHVCDSKCMAGGVSFLYLKCSICGAADFTSFFPELLPSYEYEFESNVIDYEFKKKYQEITSDYRTDKEVEIENKSLWQKIKGMFK